MRLAREQGARKPFYLVGRLGDRDLTIAAAARGLTVQRVRLLSRHSVPSEFST
jgi:hypothetical protein